MKFQEGADQIASSPVVILRRACTSRRLEKRWVGIFFWRFDDEHIPEKKPLPRGERGILDETARTCLNTLFCSCLFVCTKQRLGVDFRDES